jgi:hypothetical protein
MSSLVTRSDRSSNKPDTEVGNARRQALLLFAKGKDRLMRKLFAAAAALLTLATVGTALTAQHLGHRNSPAAVQTSLVDARQLIVSDVIDGQRPLLEAAAAFHRFNSLRPGLAEHLAEAYPGDTEAEHTCQQVLAFVRAELQERSKGSDQEPSTAAPTDSAGVLARLQGELDRARGKDGKIYLPENAS